MEKTFLRFDKPLLTVMLQTEMLDVIIERIRNANAMGCEAFGLQVEALKAEYHNVETYKRIFAEIGNKPVYVTNYRNRYNSGSTDEELASGMITLAENGATLIDVMGDMFSIHPEEMTDNSEAIKRQIELINKLHSLGVEVLMSSHIMKFTSAERVLEIALEQKRRGADIVKIVTGADNMEQQIENLRINSLLKKELDIPFLFLSLGECSLHRRLGGRLGNCMSLCVYEHDEFSTPTQPLLVTMKEIRDNLGF